MVQCWNSDESKDKVNEGLTSAEISLWIVSRYVLLAL
jgi:hypothetical protein